MGPSAECLVVDPEALFGSVLEHQGHRVLASVPALLPEILHLR